MVLQNQGEIKEQQTLIKKQNDDKDLKELKELQAHYTELNKVKTRYKEANDCGVNICFKEADGVITKFTKSDDGGYTSSCSSNGQQIEEDVYIAEQSTPYDTAADNSEQSSDSERSKKERKAFEDSFNSFLNVTDEVENDNSNDQEQLLNGRLNVVELDELIQLQKQLVDNTNQLNHLNAKVKVSGGICEREIKEIKTFLLCLDKRNSEIIRKTTKTKTELFERIKKIEGDVRFIKMDQKEIPGLSQKISSCEKRQIGIENIINELKEPVRKNTKELASLLARVPLNENNASHTNLNKQMDNIERRLTKVFIVFFIIMLCLTLGMTFWMNSGKRFHRSDYNQ